MLSDVKEASQNTNTTYKKHKLKNVNVRMGVQGRPLFLHQIEVNGSVVEHSVVVGNRIQHCI